MFEVLVIYGGEGDAQRYRCQHLCEQLRLYDINCDLMEFRNQPLEKANNYHIVIFHRVALDHWLAKLIQQLQQGGSVILFDTDDLVFDIEQLTWIRSLIGNDRLRVALYKDEVRRYRALLLAADATLVSTHFLQTEAQHLGKSAYIHRNGFSLTMQQSAEHAIISHKPIKENLVIGYASGTPTHDRDFETVKPAVLKIMHRYPKVELHLIGPLDIGAGWGQMLNRVKRTPFVPWRELPRYLARFDINLAPLERNNPFCEAKSELKFLEAALVKVPTIASRTNAFAFAINKDNGRLAETYEEWLKALDELITAPELRRQLGNKAYDEVTAQYHPIARGKELLQTLNRIYLEIKGRPLFEFAELREPTTINQAHFIEESIKHSAITQILLAPPTLFERAKYAVKNKGVLILCLQTALYIRKRFNELRERS
jgi:glycosyltransferase involved in cell wall biosynthesis